MARNYETIILIYYFIINLVLLTLMYIDKKRAIANKWRIKENTLFICSLLGGFFGGFGGMYFFRHKTKKIKFYVVFIGSLILHIAFNYVIFFKF